MLPSAHAAYCTYKYRSTHTSKSYAVSTFKVTVEVHYICTFPKIKNVEKSAVVEWGFSQPSLNSFLCFPLLAFIPNWKRKEGISYCKLMLIERSWNSSFSRLTPKRTQSKLDTAYFCHTLAVLLVSNYSTY